MSKKNKAEKKFVKPGTQKPVAKSKNTKPNPVWLFLTSFLQKPHQMFAVIAFVFGAFFLIATPPFQVPDEGDHMKRSYALAEFNTVQKRVNGESGDYLPSSIDSTIKIFNYLRWQPKNHVKSEQIKEALKIPLENDKRTFVNVTAVGYFYVSYLPQIPAIYIGKLLNLNVLYMMYLGRLFGLLFYIVCVWFALRIIPFGRYLFLTIALLPTCLAQAASWNADSVLFSLSFLGFAIILKKAFSEERFKIDKQMVLMLAILSVMGLMKGVYIPIAFLILLIPRKFFQSRFRYLAFTGSVVILSVVFFYTWKQTFSGQPEPKATTKVEATTEVKKGPGRIEILKKDPMLVIDIVENSYRVFHKMYYESTIGMLGYLDTILPKGVYSTFTFLVIFLALFEADKKYKLKIYQRLMLIIMPLGVCLITILAMYVLVTRPEAGLVAEGGQGRYIIPVLFPFFLAFYKLIPLNFNLEKNKYLVYVLYFVLIILLYRTGLTIIDRYYV
jgi:uncharacterized membrane protein